MEIVGWRRAVGNLPIVLRRELQVPLEARRGVLGALSLITMREQEGKTRHAQPLALAAGKELVDDDLSAVGEIAELRFPKHECVGLGEAIAIFEAEHSLLGEHRVDDLE